MFLIFDIFLLSFLSISLLFIFLIFQNTNIYQFLQSFLLNLSRHWCPQIFQIRDPTAAASYPKVKQPEPLVLTRAKLAALYKQALEKGSAISVAALTQALNAAGGNGNTQVGHLQLPVKYPLYNYYYFPLKSFASELQGDHQQTAVRENPEPVAPLSESRDFFDHLVYNQTFMRAYSIFMFYVDDIMQNIENRQHEKLLEIISHAYEMSICSSIFSNKENYIKDKQIYITL